MVYILNEEIDDYKGKDIITTYSNEFIINKEHKKNLDIITDIKNFYLWVLVNKTDYYYKENTTSGDLFYHDMIVMG